MKIQLAYGRSGLEIILPDALDIDVVEPEYCRGLSDQKAAVLEALRNPIAS